MHGKHRRHEWEIPDPPFLCFSFPKVFAMHLLDVTKSPTAPTRNRSSPVLLEPFSACCLADLTSFVASNPRGWRGKETECMGDVIAGDVWTCHVGDVTGDMTADVRQCGRRDGRRVKVWKTCMGGMDGRRDERRDGRPFFFSFSLISISLTGVPLRAAWTTQTSPFLHPTLLGEWCEARLS